jgi:hypothetical protein
MLWQIILIIKILHGVGIFWYDTGNDDLFGVVSSQVSEARVSDELAGINTLHKDYWKKQYNKLNFKNGGMNNNIRSKLITIGKSIG